MPDMKCTGEKCPIPELTKDATACTAHDCKHRTPPMPDIKEKLMELLTESEILCNDCGPHGNSYCIEAIANLLVSNGVTIQRWISVEEALPETSGEYLTLSTNGVTAVLPYSNKYNAFNASDDFHKASCVIPCTHWALMPGPLKGE